MQVKKFIREQLPHVEHRFDGWHAAKGKTLKYLLEIRVRNNPSPVFQIYLV